jgi:hypothetical protein
VEELSRLPKLAARLNLGPRNAELVR